MSLTNPDKVVTEQRLSEFYAGILPYLGGMPEAICNKFDKRNLYSTDEKIVGCWTDNRPLYQKTFVYSTGSTVSNQQITFNNNLPNTAKMVNYFVTSYSANGSDSTAWPDFLICKSGSSDVSGGYSVFHNSINEVVIRFGYDSGGYNSWANWTFSITYQYTKTTDAANSFNYSNETDYSTSEKIIGTWIDGKLLYQKTIVDTLPTATTEGTTVEKLISIGASVDNVVKIEALANGSGICAMMNNAVNADPYISSVTGGTKKGALRTLVYTNANSSNSNKIKVANSLPNMSGVTVYITLQYTKTS